MSYASYGPVETIPSPFYPGPSDPPGSSTETLAGKDTNWTFVRRTGPRRLFQIGGLGSLDVSQSVRESQIS